MTGATKTVARGGGRPRGYFTTDGTKVVASTTVCNRFKESGGLVQAANNVGLEGKTLEEAWYGAKGIGSEVHAMVESYLHGEDIGQPKTLEAMNGFEAFREWWEAGKFTAVYTEVPIVSDTYRFGGTPDAILRDSKGRLCLGDWKVANGLFSNNLWQIASYGLLVEEWLGEKLTGGYHLVQFSKEHGDFTHKHFPELNDAARLFLMLRDAYDLDRAVAKRAR